MLAVTRPLDTLGQRLRHARKMRRWSQEELAEAAQEKQPNISKIERGEIQQTTAIARLAAALRVPPLWLEVGNGPEPDWTPTQHVAEGMGVYTVAQSVSLPGVETALTSAQQVPVIGTLKLGAEKMFELRASGDGKPIGHVLAPGVGTDSYAVQVFGDELYPTIRHGSCLVVQPSAELVEGELVLVELAEGTHLVAELVTMRPDSVTLAHANGGSRRTLAADAVAAVHPVVATLPGFRFKPAAPAP